MMVLGYSEFCLMLVNAIDNIIDINHLQQLVPCGADFHTCMQPFVEDMLRLRHIRCNKLTGNGSLYVRLANVVIDQREVTQLFILTEMCIEITVTRWS